MSAEVKGAQPAPPFDPITVLFGSSEEQTPLSRGYFDDTKKPVKAGPIVDLTQYVAPSHFPDPTKDTIIKVGDLHANPLLLLQAAHHTGILSREAKTEMKAEADGIQEGQKDITALAAILHKDYQEALDKAWALYCKQQDCLQQGKIFEASDSEQLEAYKLQVHEQIQKFRDIIAKFKFKKDIKSLVLIGDESNDRGIDDGFIFLLLQKCVEEGVPLKIIPSNHGMSGLMQLLHGFDAKKPRYIPGTARRCRTSQVNFYKCVQLGLVTPERYQFFVQNYYLKSLQLLDYHYMIAADGKKRFTLISHAPIGLETVRALAAYYEVPYDDASVQALANTIDAINHIYKVDISDINSQAFFLRYQAEGAVNSAQGDIIDAYYKISQHLRDWLPSSGNSLGSKGKLTAGEMAGFGASLPIFCPIHYGLWVRHGVVDLPLTLVRGDNIFALDSAHGHEARGDPMQENMRGLDGMLGYTQANETVQKWVLPVEHTAPGPGESLVAAPLSATQGKVPEGGVFQKLNGQKYLQKLWDLHEVLELYHRLLKKYAFTLSQQYAEDILQKLLVQQIKISQEAINKYWKGESGITKDNVRGMLKIIFGISFQAMHIDMEKIAHDSSFKVEYLRKSRLLLAQISPDKEELRVGGGVLVLAGGALVLAGITAYAKHWHSGFSAMPLVFATPFLGVAFLASFAALNSGPYQYRPIAVALLVGAAAAATYWTIAKTLPLDPILIALSLAIAAGLGLLYYNTSVKRQMRNFDKILQAAKTGTDLQQPAESGVLACLSRFFLCPRTAPARVEASPANSSSSSVQSHM